VFALAWEVECDTCGNNNMNTSDPKSGGPRNNTSPNAIDRVVAPLSPTLNAAKNSNGKHTRKAHKKPNASCVDRRTTAA